MTDLIETRADLEAIRDRALPDLLAPTTLAVNIGLASCGIAAGAAAAYDRALAELAPEGVQVRRTGCLGYCEVEPLVEVLGPGPGGPRVVYQRITEDKIGQVVRSHREGEYLTDWALGQMTDAWSLLDENYGRTPSLTRVPDLADLAQTPFYTGQYKVALRNCGYIDPDNIEHYIARGGYLALWRALTEMEPAEIVEAVIASGLRGRGGAGFPTGMKWRFMAQSPGDVKYVIVNADEGDPGAYMDRSVLEGDPHSVIEGLTIAARATGARHGYIYARHEYPLAVQRLETALDRARERGLLGTKIFGADFDFDVTISTGAGAFVCGEETALMASIMGDPGRPRPRPPFPAQSGLWGRPSNINNVETMANVPAIIVKGAEWYAGIGGGRGSSGTKVFSLVGKIKNTGLVEVPIGTTLRRIVFDVGGGVPKKRRFKAVQTGGPSGGCIPEKFLDTPVDYETLGQLGAIMGSGGMIVMDESTCMVDLGRYFIEFLMEESCGKCVPCREGLLTLHEVLLRICAGQGRPGDLEKLRDIGQTMKDFSLCGLGQTAPNPVLSTLRYFEDEFRAHIHDHKCPAGVCRDLITFRIDPDKCTGCMVCARHCPQQCISGEKKKVHVIDESACIRCGACRDSCKFDAVVVE
jgi:NADH:ubiquinone oxidoreductase subunit F (NADH-binding)/(2Fe-2S) ferredoxin/ferredoxin